MICGPDQRHTCVNVRRPEIHLCQCQKTRDTLVSMSEDQIYTCVNVRRPEIHLCQCQKTRDTLVSMSEDINNLMDGLI